MFLFDDAALVNSTEARKVHLFTGSSQRDDVMTSQRALAPLPGVATTPTARRRTAASGTTVHSHTQKVRRGARLSRKPNFGVVVFTGCCKQRAKHTIHQRWTECLAQCNVGLWVETMGVLKEPDTGPAIFPSGRSRYCINSP